MKYWLPALIVTILLLSCNKKNTYENELDGTYIGFFHRNRHDTSQVTLRFSNNVFEGQSSNAKYPAIGKGSFIQQQNTLTFTDSCEWTPDFETSLILRGDFNYRENNDGTIRLWRKRGASTDEYVLMRSLRSQ